MGKNVIHATVSGAKLLNKKITKSHICRRVTAGLKRHHTISPTYRTLQVLVYPIIIH